MEALTRDTSTGAGAEAGAAVATPLPGAAPALTAVDFDPFARGAEVAATSPTTEAQREIWTAAQLSREASCAFNESCSLALSGPLDREALAAALAAAARRHEALRATVSKDGLTLLIAASASLEPALVDLCPLATGERQAALARLLEREVCEPFDLERGPLARARLVRCAEEEHILVITAHHIVLDGWSTGVLLRDLAALYNHARGLGAPPRAPESFAAYARDEAAFARTEEHAGAEAFWLSRFVDTPPPLELPLDRARPARRTFPSAREDRVLDARAVRELRAAGARLGASFFTMLLAGFAALLHKLAGESDIVVGIPAAGQAATGRAALVGHCLNTLPVRLAVDPAAPFADLVAAARAATLDALEHQRYTFGTLLRKLPLRRDPSRLPLVSVLFNLDQALSGADLPFDGLGVELASNPRRFESFDLFVNAFERGEGRLALECQYNTDLYDGASVRRWLASLEVLLAAAAAAPGARVEALPLLDEAGRREVLARRGPDAGYPREQVHRLFEAQAARAPAAVAVTFEGASLTYAELDARASRLARRLRALGAGRDALVGVHLERSLDMVAALLGIWKAGAAYVPLDPAFPRERLAFMIEDAAMPLIVTEARLAAALPAGAARLVLVDAGAAEIAREEAGRLDDLPGASADDLAYVIYTSGSTGRPKGVEVPHGAVANFLAAVRERPGLRAEDVVLAITTLSFDIAVLEIHLPLTTGARVVLATREGAMDGAWLLRAIEREGVTVVQATPSTWRLLLAAGWEGGAGLKAITGGEAVPLDLARALLARSASAWNMYGPTEATVWSTCEELRAPLDGVTIGRPIANTRAYVLDAARALVPPGVPGELWLAGHGIARGYRGRAALTAERFVPDPFEGGAGRMYRTGDRARLLSDGRLEFLGRADFQVKVRGYRIEPGEIEAALAAHAGIAESVVVAREDRPGDARLVAYVRPAPGAAAADDAALRAHLRATLPEYMVPQHFVRLARLPLTPNGKVDRRALPAPQEAASEGAAARLYTAPRGETEALLAKLFAEALGVGRVGVEDDFFALGGHSLVAVQLLSRLRKDHAVALPVRALFEAPTVARLAPLVEAARAGRSATEVVPRRPEGAPVPLTAQQQRVFFLEQMHPGLSVYNVRAAWRIRGPLVARHLESALSSVVRRHEPLRTSLRLTGAGPAQVAAAPAETPLAVEDLSALPEAEREAELARRCSALAVEAFDLASGPLFRARLFRLAPEEHALFFCPHLSVFDGWSFDILLRDLGELYIAATLGRAPDLPALPISYGDFAAWQEAWIRRPEVERAVREEVERLRRERRPAEVPGDRPRPATLSFKGGTRWIRISRETTDALTRLGRRAGATLSMVALAALDVLVHRWTGERDLLVGMPVRGRSRPETEDLIGYFVNMVILRTPLDPEASFLDLLARVKAVSVEAMSREDVPFELLVRHLDVSRTPAYQAYFSFQDATARRWSFGGLDLTRIPVDAPTAQTQLGLWLMETRAGLQGGLMYSADLYDEATAERFARQYEALLAAVIADPTVPVGRAPILPPEEKSLLLAAAPRASGPAAPVHERFEAQARRTPSAIAVSHEGREVTYAELSARAGDVARRLRAIGVAPGDRVGVLLEPGPDLLAAELATWLAGGACVPLDATDPAERLAAVVEAARVRALVASRALLGALPGRPGLVVLDGEDVPLEAGARPPAGDPPAGDPPAGDPPAGDACALYCSGDPARPSAAALSHAEVAAFLDAARALPGLEPGDAVLALAPPSSSQALFGHILPLTIGARVLLAPGGAGADGERLREAIRDGRPTVVQALPSQWRRLVRAGWEGGPGLRAVSGGEPLAPDLARALLARTSAALHVTGADGVAGFAFCERLEAPLERVLLGRPLAHVAARVLDPRGELCPIGIPGELHVAAAGASPAPTGDRARVLADGRLERRALAEGRIEAGGLRIDRGGIEAAMAAHPAVAEAAAALRRDEAGDERLVGYFALRAEASFTETALRKHLRRALPEAAVPARLVELPRLPRDASGALDRAALPDPFVQLAPAAPRAAPRTSAERLLAQLWAEALGPREFGVDDNFFEVGGHSLACMQVIARVAARTGKRLSPRELFTGTLAQAARQLDLPDEAEVAPPAEEAPVSLARRLLDGLRGAWRRR